MTNIARPETNTHTGNGTLMALLSIPARALNRPRTLPGSTGAWLEE